MTLGEERGGIFAISALMMPVFLLLIALVLDAGTWYAHKRSLQNRADAGALAAGVEYLSQLSGCADPASRDAAAAAITEKAKEYAGANGTAVAYNSTPSTQSRMTVAVNAKTDDPNNLVDNTDGDPCEPHGAGRQIWTDVIARERDLDTLAGSFGVSLSSITARARVEVNEINGAKGNVLPFVAEWGTNAGCVWALFVNAGNGRRDDGFSVDPGNPVRLSRTSANSWTGTVHALVLTDSDDDVAVQYWAGPREGNPSCDFDSARKRSFAHLVGDEAQPVAIDWINVYDDNRAPAALEPPKLRSFALTSHTCGGPGFLYTASLDPFVQCRIGFSAVVDTGDNESRGRITVDPIRTDVRPVTVSYDTRGGGGRTTVTGTITVRPNEVVSPSRGVLQDYTQTGPTYFKVTWRQRRWPTDPRCPIGGCSGTFEGDTITGLNAAGNGTTTYDDVQQATFVSDPLGSTPLTSTSLGLSANSLPALSTSSGFTITLGTTAVDKKRVVLLRAAMGSSTRAVWCGGAAAGLGALKDAFGTTADGGCQVPLVVNKRSGSCSPPVGGWPAEPSAGPSDCVRPEQDSGTDTIAAAVRDGIQSRFDCGDADAWDDGTTLPADADPRWVFVPLTGFGDLAALSDGDFVPVEAFARFYVTDWGGAGLATCHGPPRGFDPDDVQLWGHFADIVTLSDAVITGDAPCDLDIPLVTCKPQLVR